MFVSDGNLGNPKNKIVQDVLFVLPYKTGTLLETYKLSVFYKNPLRFHV